MCIPGRTNATHNRPEQAPRGRGSPRFPFCRGKEEGRAAAAGGIKGCGGRQHSCSFHVQKSVSRTSPSRFSEEGGWSLNGTEQNSPFFDNDIKGDGCLCVWSGACLKCSEDSGVVGQVHCCLARGMIITCYWRPISEATVSVTCE